MTTTQYDTVTDGEVEPKVKAATAGALSGGVVVGGLVDYLLSVSLFHGGDVPGPVASFVQFLVPIAAAGGGAWLAGYRARHVQRAPVVAAAEAAVAGLTVDQVKDALRFAREIRAELEPQ